MRQSGKSTFQADRETIKPLVGEVLEKLRKDQCDQNMTNKGSGKTEVEGVGRSWIMQALWGASNECWNFTLIVLRWEEYHLNFALKGRKDGSGETSHEAADTVQVRDAGKLL